MSSAFGLSMFKAFPQSTTRRRRSSLLAWLSKLWNGWRSALVIVKPETVIAWHRRGFRLYVIVLNETGLRRMWLASTVPRDKVLVLL
jgi:hypothetical protein